MRTTRVLMASAAIAVALLLAGCSGGGRDVSAQVTPAGTFVGDQATLVTLNMEWLPILFPNFFPTTPSGTPTIDDPVTNPDGSTDWHFVDGDGTVEDWHTDPDGSTCTAHLVHPGGLVETATATQVFYPDGSLTFKEHRVYPNGMRLDRDYDCPAWSDGLDHLYNSQTGTMTLPDGRTLDVKAWEYGLHIVLQVDGHEGWTYGVSAPSALGQEVPDASRPATGSLTRGSEVTQFTLPANPSGQQWLAMGLTAPGGYIGSYELGATLTGQGTVKQNGALLMTVRWGSTGAVTESLADGLGQVSQPSSAALDFMVDKWLRALCEYGPNPR